MESKIEEAIRVAGSLTELASLLKVSPQVIYNWRKRGIPAERVLAIEEATGVNRSDLRPDLYPRQEAA